jgi:hypothetical protein
VGLGFEKWFVRATALITLTLVVLKFLGTWSASWDGAISFGATLVLVSFWARLAGHGGGQKMSGNGITAERSIAQRGSIFDWIQAFGTILQTIAILGGVWFATSELSQARRAYQATTVSEIHGRTSELQWRVIDNESLAPLLLDKVTPEAKQAVVAAMVINEFATIFDLWKLGGIPDPAWVNNVLDVLRVSLEAGSRTAWESVPELH